MKGFYYLTIIMVASLSWYGAQGQEVEHNFEMPPQKTNCDSLDINDLSEKEKINQIEQTEFRLKQNLKLNRVNGFQAAWFYSCDNKNGFLVVKVDNEKRLYENISIDMWNEFQSSGDFLGFIKKRLEPE